MKYYLLPLACIPINFAIGYLPLKESLGFSYWLTIISQVLFIALTISLIRLEDSQK